MEDHLNFFGNGRQHFLFLMENDLNILDNGRKPLKKNNANWNIYNWNNQVKTSCFTKSFQVYQNYFTHHLVLLFLWPVLLSQNPLSLILGHPAVFCRINHYLVIKKIGLKVVGVTVIHNNIHSRVKQDRLSKASQLR